MDRGSRGNVLFFDFDDGTSHRNFSLEARDGAYGFCVRSGRDNAESGRPCLASPQGTLEADVMTHVVATRSALGDRRLYLNGAQVAHNRVGGSLAGWASDFTIRLSGAHDDTHFFHGTYAHVAVYCRALDEIEVSSRFGLGPE